MEHGPEKQKPTPEAMEAESTEPTVLSRISKLATELKLIILEAAVDLLVQDGTRLAFNLRYLAQLHTDENAWHKTAREYICALAPKATLLVETADLPLLVKTKNERSQYCKAVFYQARRVVVQMDRPISEPRHLYPLYASIRYLERERRLAIYVYRERTEEVRKSVEYIGFTRFDVMPRQNEALATAQFHEDVPETNAERDAAAGGPTPVAVEQQSSNYPQPNNQALY